MKRFPLSFGTIPRMVTIAFFCLLSASFQTAHAGRNAGGAFIVHTNDAVNYSAGRDYCGPYFDDPGTCEAAGTRTDKDENTPAVIWVIAAFPPGATPVGSGTAGSPSPGGVSLSARSYGHETKSVGHVQGVRMRFLEGSVSRQGWHVQWESVPPGQESEAP